MSVFPKSVAPGGVVDVHAHIVPADFPAAPAACCDPWPSMVHEGERADVVIGGRVFRKIDNRSWDVPRRVADMDGQGVALQALSPIPELLSTGSGRTARWTSAAT